ncbi:uncharacterized protein LAJ45_09644 [Morchella importuna]|uniref:Uncharacterized protein n=1 Tax=Morchella conica CCBAS932 TaxID=1392247 RepID=A0A3N4K8G4_9PEZI|nr:uncharacterized protein LAJ45_09644 [Morchella importuna]KAH8146203.1 hypothetical protein LAJ45_09644 [Morchella importuna]RPB06817.1 hypothetical protein P167DRAFT_609861 [Morchella conica CCBAS932]
MSATSTTPSEGPSSQLLGALGTNAEANRVGAQALAHLALHGPKLPSSSSDPQDPSLQLLEGLKINAESNRVNAQALTHLALSVPKPLGGSPNPQRTVRPGSFVINERVGTITTAEWETLGNERISHLAKVLRGIADELGSPHTWEEIGEIVRGRLSLFGFTFRKLSELEVKKDWGIVVAKGDDKRAIVTQVLDCNRVDIGPIWHTNEMLRVWSQLMDITDAWTAG